MSMPKSTNLCMETQLRDNAVVVFVWGSVDMIDVPEFQEELEKYAVQANLVVVVEFTGLEFIGGAGLDAIVSAYDLGKVHGTRIVMAGNNALVQRIVEITRLDRIIPIFADIESAVA